MSHDEEPSLYVGVSASSTRSIAITTDYKPRCPTCGGLLAQKATRPWEIDCRRCSQPYHSPPNGVPLPVPPPPEERARRAAMSKRARGG